MSRLWKGTGGGLLRSAAGKALRCDDCPCGAGGACEHCEGLFPAETAVTITGVTGCGGRCDARNRTLILPRWGLCAWGASGVFPQPVEEPGSDCAALVGKVFGVAEVAILAPGSIELTIRDEVVGGLRLTVRFTGTFDGPCNAISVALSEPSIDSAGTMAYHCPDEDCESWCDWSGAAAHVEAL